MPTPGKRKNYINVLMAIEGWIERNNPLTPFIKGENNPLPPFSKGELPT
jgi:hypothetical protein